MSKRVSWAKDDEDSEEEDLSEEDEESDVDSVASEQGADNEDRVDDLKYDLYNLTAFDFHGLQLPGAEEDEGKRREAALVEKTTRSVQLLVKRIFSLPVDIDDVAGPLAVLPADDVSKLPRAQHIPEPKPKTKWEKFAEEKGIKKTKRERMVFDETRQEFAPRYGYKRVNGGIEDQPIVEIKAGQDPFADPWENARVEKKQRVNRNLKNQAKNQERADRALGKAKPSGLQVTSSSSADSTSFPGIPVGLQSGAPAKRGKEGLKQALQLAQHSTASMGRFDELRKGEPAPKMKGKKRSFRDNFEGLGDAGGEKDIMKKQLRIVQDKVDKKARGVTNSLAEYEGILPDAPTDAFRQRKGKGKVSGAPKANSRDGRKREKKSGSKLFKRKH